MSEPCSVTQAIGKSVGTKVKFSERYDSMKIKRSNYLERGRTYSRMTLPYVLPESKDNRDGGDNQHGFSGFGAKMVNFLSNKLVQTLFPVHTSFFALDFAEAEKEKLRQAGYEPSELNVLLTRSVKKCSDYEGSVAARTTLVEVEKHLITSGNVCLFVPPTGDDLQAIPLDSYAVTRDYMGTLIELMTEQKKALMTFSEEHQNMIKANANRKLHPEEEMTMLTAVVRDNEGMYQVMQSVEDILINKSQAVAPEDLPWIPLRWNKCFGEDYGRGLIEDHYGDFVAHEFLSEAKMKGLVLIADVKYLVKAGAITDIDELASAPTGEFLVGNADDVTVLQLEKFADFTPIIEALRDIERSLAEVFLYGKGNRREGERVTAYEVSLDAQELEQSLGGVYSLQSETLQKPYANLLLKQVGFPLPKESVTPNIITGMQALGKAGDLDKIRTYTEVMQMPQQWPEGIQGRVKWKQYSDTVSSALSFDTSWLMDDAEYAESQQAQSGAMQENAALGEAFKALPKLLESRLGGNE